jgi:hypothetical protein
MEHKALKGSKIEIKLRKIKLEIKRFKMKGINIKDGNQRQNMEGTYFGIKKNSILQSFLLSYTLTFTFEFIHFFLNKLVVFNWRSLSL